MIQCRQHRAAVSEILGAMILLVIVIGAFAWVFGFYSSTAQLQETNIISQYNEGMIKNGQLISLVYHWENTTTGGEAKIGLYNFGTYNVTLNLVFINATREKSFSILDTSTGTVVLAISPGELVVLDITGISGNAASSVESGNYELFIYGSDNLAYVYAL
jgi:hypothetical protein